MADVKIVEATQSFATYLPDGTPFNVRAKEDRFRSDDPVVKANPGNFGEISVRSSLPAAAATSTGPTETATAAPGERRAVTKPPAGRTAAGAKGGKADA